MLEFILFCFPQLGAFFPSDNGLDDVHIMLCTSQLQKYIVKRTRHRCFWLLLVAQSESYGYVRVMVSNR